MTTAKDTDDYIMEQLGLRRILALLKTIDTWSKKEIVKKFDAPIEHLGFKNRHWWLTEIYHLLITVGGWLDVISGIDKVKVKPN